MRRLVGLIALLVLILGAAWLARIDFDLTRIADFDALFEPAGQETATKTSSGSAPTETAGEPSLPSDASSQSETDTAMAPDGAESQLADTSEMAVGKPMPDEFDTTGPSSVETAAESAEHQTDASALPEAAAGETDTAMAGPAEDGAITQAAPPVDAPRFDIVRVEPTGETVIAGIAEPEAMVEVLNGPEPVASAEANARGEWALVLETPLPPGTHDLGIRATSPDHSQVTLSDQRVAVSVPENADEAPLVVLNEPDAPSRVMQVPAGAEAAAGPAVAAAEAQADAMTGTPPSAETEVASAPQAEPKEEASAGSEGAKMAAASSEPAPGSMETPASETGTTSAPAPMAEPSMSSDASEKSAAAPAAETASKMAAAPSTAAPAEAGSAAMTAPSETSAAGTMAAGAPAAGSDAPAVMAETTSNAASVPEASSTEMAAAPPASSEAPAAPETAAGGTSVAEPEAKPPTVEAAPPPPTPEVGVAAVEAETNGALYIAGTATTPEPVRVYVDDEFVGETTPTESGTWLLETKRELAPDEYTVRADQVDAGSGTVVARAEVPFAREIAVAALKPVGEPVSSASTAEASGSVAGPMTVIIKRGDNLWRISREMYGRGIRFSTIYQANRDQIRNPNRIYPGQVFVLPAGDTNWQN